MEANKQKFELFGNEIKERKFELLLLNFLGWWLLQLYFINKFL